MTTRGNNTNGSKTSTAGIQGDLPTPVVICKRSGRARTISFQWYDGAGELHYHTLDPIESLSYLDEEAEKQEMPANE